MRLRLKRPHKVKTSAMILIFLISCAFNGVVIWYILFFLCASNIKILLQNWGDYADMSQAITIYVAYASDVLLIGWFGIQLTQHVRQNVFLFLVLPLKHHVHNVYGASNQLSNYGSFWVLRMYISYPVFCSDLSLANFETGVLSISRFRTS
jgi:hypothetical protein